MVPRKVGSDGKFVSHQIPHHFKRSLYAATDRGGSTIEDDAVHYRLKIGEKDYHLELRPNPSLVAPGESKIKINAFALISVSTFFFPRFEFRKFSKCREMQRTFRDWSTGAVIEEHRRPAGGGGVRNSDDNLLKDAKLREMRDSQCHYLGRVHGHSGDSALSTCYGLVSPTFSSHRPVV